MYLRKGVYYTDFYDDSGKRRRRSLRTADAAVAAAKEGELRSLDAPALAQRSLSWKEFKHWYYAFLSDNKARGTKFMHELSIRHLEAFRRLEFLEEITPDFLLLFKSYLKEEAARRNGKPGAPGRNRLMQAIKTMMYTAERFKKTIIKQDWRIVEKEKGVSANRVVWHPVEELRQIRDILRGDLLTAFYLGWEEGLRRGEIINLYKTDYDPINHTITVSAKEDWRPKTQKSARTIPLRPDSEAAIIRSIAAAPEGSPYIINIGRNRKNCNYLSHDYVYIVKKELPHIHSFLHKLRHTYGTLLAKEGVPIKTISNLMGHSNVLITEKYVHLGIDDYISAAARLPTI